MAEDGENFLARWSRRKLDTAKPAAAAPAQPVATPPVELPSPDSLTFESDFKAFMRAKIDEGVKRAALKKLFSDPRFNVMDGLDIYIDDYSKDDPIPAAMLASLEHSKATLSGGRTPEPAPQETDATPAEAALLAETGDSAQAAASGEPAAGVPADAHADPRQDT